MSVCPSVPMYVCVYVCLSTKSFFDFNEIWHAGRRQWLMHESMQYGLIQGQGQGHKPFTVGNLDVFKSCLLCLYSGSWQLTTDSWTRAQYLNLIGPDFWYLAKFLCHVTLKSAQTRVVKSRPSVPVRGKFFPNILYIWLSPFLTTMQYIMYFWFLWMMSCFYIMGPVGQNVMFHPVHQVVSQVGHQATLHLVRFSGGMGDEFFLLFPFVLVLLMSQSANHTMKKQTHWLFMINVTGLDRKEITSWQ